MRKTFLLLLGLSSSLNALGQVASTSTYPIGPNLALNKPATASSSEGAGYLPRFAFDADYSSRWASDRSNPATVDTQWLAVNLGATYAITKVRVNWEAAYGKDYQIQVSPDGTTWKTVRTVTGNTAAVNLLSGIAASGQYVRLYNTARGTGYGYSVYELEVSASNAAPTVQLLQPAANSTYSGTINLSANASDDDGAVSKVGFYVDNVLVGTDTSAPYEAPWLTTSVAPGTHVAKAIATDDNGATATSYEREFYVVSPASLNTPPTVAITSPDASYPVSDLTTLSADASDADGTVSSVAFYVDNALIRTVLASPYAVRWAASTVANGPHVLRAVATDNLGTTATAERTFTVRNTTTATKAVPGKLEAENYDGQSGIQTEPTADVGGGLNVGYLDAGDYLDYNVTAATNSAYSIQFRVASWVNEAQLQLQRLYGLEGVATLATVTLPNTGGGQVWQTVTVDNITLGVGDQKLRVKFLTSGFNLNWLNFAYTAAASSRTALAAAPAATPAPAAELGAYPNPSAGLVHLIGMAEGAAVRIIALDGALVLNTTVHDNALDISKLSAGTYLALVQQNGKLVRLKLTKQ
ncbi:MAG: Ig-like domain-containing protein [Janthinobacterium lividum]